MISPPLSRKLWEQRIEGKVHIFEIRLLASSAALDLLQKLELGLY